MYSVMNIVVKIFKYYFFFLINDLFCCFFKRFFFLLIIDLLNWRDIVLKLLIGKNFLLFWILIFVLLLISIFIVFRYFLGFIFSMWLIIEWIGVFL